jgi:putative superfamily III holin-X
MADNGITQTDRSFGEIAKDLSRDLSELVHKELELAKAEMTTKARGMGQGAGLLGGAGGAALAALGAFTAFLVLLLAEAMDAWLAALIVAVGFGAVAYLLQLMGRRRIAETGPPVPEKTVESVKEDVQWAKSHAKSNAR